MSVLTVNETQLKGLVLKESVKVTLRRKEQGYAALIEINGIDYQLFDKTNKPKEKIFMQVETALRMLVRIGVGKVIVQLNDEELDVQTIR